MRVPTIAMLVLFAACGSEPKDDPATVTTDLIATDDGGALIGSLVWMDEWEAEFWNHEHAALVRVDLGSGYIINPSGGDSWQIRYTGTGCAGDAYRQVDRDCATREGRTPTHRIFSNGGGAVEPTKVYITEGPAESIAQRSIWNLADICDDIAEPVCAVRVAEITGSFPHSFAMPIHIERP